AEQESAAPVQRSQCNHDSKGPRSPWAVNRRKALQRNILGIALSPQHGASGIYGRSAELLLDADQLVVFGQPVGARQRPGLDLPAIRRDREIGDRRILGLARPM